MCNESPDDQNHRRNNQQIKSIFTHLESSKIFVILNENYYQFTILIYRNCFCSGLDFRFFGDCGGVLFD